MPRKEIFDASRLYLGREANNKRENGGHHTHCKPSGPSRTSLTLTHAFCIIPKMPALSQSVNRNNRHQSFQHFSTKYQKRSASASVGTLTPLNGVTRMYNVGIGYPVYSGGSSCVVVVWGFSVINTRSCYLPPDDRVLMLSVEEHYWLGAYHRI